MTSENKRLEMIYDEVSQALHDPRSLGLGPQMPTQLKCVLEKVLRGLSEVMEQGALYPRDGDLEYELSQDADSPSWQLGEPL